MEKISEKRELDSNLVAAANAASKAAGLLLTAATLKLSGEPNLGEITQALASLFESQAEIAKLR